MKYHIQDWAGNILFNGKKFKTFEDGWDFLYTQLADEADKYEQETGKENFYDEYYVEPVGE